ncbi:MAG: HPr family phosphocarrier protein [Bacillus sp. (in: Bacteria)]|nr:HPr family phosphocarrier protein [Bacillus sp. (in: firmicutes)]
MLGVMFLEIRKGSEIEIITLGSDEIESIAAITETITTQVLGK